MGEAETEEPVMPTAVAAGKAYRDTALLSRLAGTGGGTARPAACTGVATGTACSTGCAVGERQHGCSGGAGGEVAGRAVAGWRP